MDRNDLDARCAALKARMLAAHRGAGENRDVFHNTCCADTTGCQDRRI